MEGGVESLAKGIGCLCLKAYKEINHVRRLSDYAEEMKSKIDEVKAQASDVRIQCEGRLPLNVVSTWLDQAEKALTLAQHTWEVYQSHQHTRCIFGRCPHCLFQRTISKQVRTSTANLATILEKRRNHFPSNAELGLAPAVRHLPTPKLVGAAFQEAQLRIESWLTDDKIRIIGVYGMGGVGKTSLLETVNNAQRGISPFNSVVFVTVSQNASIGNLQKSIARKLEMKLSEDSAADEDLMRVLLYNFLKGKKFLLILDDMWSKIDLYRLGIGIPENGSKILLSTRTLHVCREMETDTDLLLKPLLREEAWQLFCRGAFRDGICVEGFTQVAEQVCAECGGLPLAIKAVAAAMRNNTNMPEWRRALDFLERGESSFYGGESSEEEEGVLKRLEWSYKQLPNETIKLCFVYCAAYPEDFWIESHDIIKLWMGEGLVQDADRGEDVLIKLTDRCLLEWRDCSDPSWEPLLPEVRMHELIRELAIVNGAKYKSCIFRAGKNIMHEFLHCNLNCERMSLMDNCINSFPQKFNYPNLVSLWLTHNPITQVDAVMNITSLKILDLSHTKIQELPESVSQLKHLVFLNLSYTTIEALPEAVVDLSSLQILVLRYCGSLSSLPSGMDKLKSLNHLDLFGSYFVRSCPRELSHLTSLKTLRLYRCLTGNEEAESSVMRAKDLASLQSLKELQLAVELPLTEGVIKTLPRVRVLTLHCAGTNQEDLPEDIHHITVHEYIDFTLFGVRELPNRICDFRNLRSLRIRGCEHLTELPELFKLPNLTVLGLRECKHLKDLGIGFWSAGGFPMLECLSLSILPELDQLLSTVGEVGDRAMQKLQRLDISNCKKLKELPLGLDRLIRLNLRALFCDDEFWNGIIWQQHTIKNNFERIRKKTPLETTLI